MITIYSYTTLFYYILVQYVDRAKRQMSGMTVMEKVRPAARSFCGSCWSLGVVRNIAQLLSLSIIEYCRPSHTTRSRNTGDMEDIVWKQTIVCDESNPFDNLCNIPGKWNFVHPFFIFYHAYDDNCPNLVSNKNAADCVVEETKMLLMHATL